jgi:hypothetical protein
MTALDLETWIDAEEVCYPGKALVRKGRALYRGKLIAVRCGIPDTFFTIPARVRVKGKSVRGYVSVEKQALRPYAEEQRYFVFHAEGERCEN